MTVLEQQNTPLTPMMVQWQSCKLEAKNALLLFRLGDFYEAFHEDAERISKELNLTLTARQGIPMCGVPFHAADNYIDRLVAKGYKVAVAEQTEDPKLAKGLVKRAVTRIVTPGTTISTNLLSEKRNNFFASITQAGSCFGLSYMDLTTGAFHALEMKREEELLDELCRLRPSEILTQRGLMEAMPHIFEEVRQAFSCILNPIECAESSCYEALTDHFQKSPCDAVALRERSAAANAAGMLLLYLKKEYSLGLEQILSMQTERSAECMAIDRATLRHLELIESPSDDAHSLFHFLDETLTPMGARLLRAWVQRPLLSCEEIALRQKKITAFLAAEDLANEAHAQLRKIRDLERLMMRIAARAATPRDLYALGLSLSYLPALQRALYAVETPEIREECDNLFLAAPLSQRILSSFNDSLPLRLGEGDIFRDGVYQKLDDLRALSRESTRWISQYQQMLRETTGLKTLKVGYTRAFGYYIEVSRVQGERMPASFAKKQTLVNTERFTSEELKKFEYQILAAEEQAKAFEAEAFEELRAEAAKEAAPLAVTSRTLARIDVLLALAKTARRWRWICPVVDASDQLDITDGRHPILEKTLGNASFIPNDTLLNQERQMMLITGPNMAGKSTYIRQVALIVILAQMGSYVPAASAHIGVIDRLFSRIGANDHLARGHSTFMVEMSETAHILTMATSRSLVLLDEVGRGTSTYDGIAIAWAVAEYLLTTKKSQAKTLFATHYWELTQLEQKFPHALNYQTAVEESLGKIIFLRKILRGGTDRSYGIHVAKLAGLPPRVILRAEELLAKLETAACRKKPVPSERQLSLFQNVSPEEHALLEELKSLDLQRMTPLEALQTIDAWQRALTQSS